MRNWSELATDRTYDLSTIVGVLFDLDDTFLTHGQLHAEVLASLHALRTRGFRLVGVTGRPVGYAQVLLPTLGIDAIVAENGSVGWRRKGRTFEAFDWTEQAERARRKVRLDDLVEQIRSRVPDLGPTGDGNLRVSDRTWDIAEFVQADPSSVAELTTAIRESGFRVFQSSVHVHATLDGWDKASGVLRFLQEEWGEDPTSARGRYVYVGDSTNDAACFYAFAMSVGVANVRAALPKLSVPPVFVTSDERGRGFIEVAETLCRRTPSPG